MALDVGQLVTLNLPLGATTLEPNTNFVFTAERFEAHPAALYIIIACSEDTTDHRRLDGPGTTCVFYHEQYRCRWADDRYEDGHIREVTLELTRIK